MRIQRVLNAYLTPRKLNQKILNVHLTPRMKIQRVLNAYLSSGMKIQKGREVFFYKIEITYAGLEYSGIFIGDELRRFRKGKIKNTMKKVIIFTLFLLFALALVLFLDKTSNITDISIPFFVALSIGLSALVYLIRICSNPPEWLFQMRFVIYNFQYGLFFAIGMSAFKLIEHPTFNIFEFVFNILVFTLADFFFSISTQPSYFKFRKLIKKIGSLNRNNLALIDLAYYVDSNEYRTLGYLILEDYKLCFYSADENKCLFDSNISDITPVVEKVSFLNIPVGLDLQFNETKIFMKIPYYWLNVIAKNKQNLLIK